ncbi:MAG: enoyl-CoA hydratase/isomerase family protein [Bacteroidales bacterium]|nr:enoyl-CoA hydratase/isomerase family protein [Bacteroidales bacterium]
MEYKFLKSEVREDGICVLTVSAPKSLNALCSAILSEIDDFVTNIDLKTIKAIILTGDGEKAFVAGADIAEMKDLDDAAALQFAALGANAFKKLEDLNIPTIAAVNGFALGGGCELAMACDIRIASSNAKFGQPEVTLGIIPGFSGTYRLPKLVGPAIAKELIYTGKMIDAQEAYRIGLVNMVCEQAELMDKALEMMHKILRNAPCAVAAAKRCINDNYDMTAKEAIALENVYFSRCFATEDQKHGMTAFLNKEKPQFKGV